MDGATIHKSKYLTDKLNNNNIEKIINVPYSPQFNPIEKVFNVLKMELKKSFINTEKQLIKFIYSFEKKINKTGFRNYFYNTYEALKMSI